MADLSIGSILMLVDSFHRAEGAKPNRSLYISLLNRCLGEISGAVGGFDTYWNNDSSDTARGTLDMDDDSAEVTFPTDVINIYDRGVYWNDTQIDMVTGGMEDLFRTNPTWRSDEGQPSLFARTERGIIFNCIPDDADYDGLLTIYGRGSIPALDNANGAIAYLGVHRQWALADYIIAYLPIEYGEKEEFALQFQIGARQQARERWEKEFQRIIHDADTRRHARIAEVGGL